MSTKFPFFIILFFCISCTEMQKKYIGAYVIEDIRSNLNEIEIYDLLANGFTLDENNRCHLPIINASDNSDCTWHVLKKNGKEYIEFEGLNNPFLGKYLVYAENGNYSILTLVSDSLKLKCIKVWGVYK